MKPTQLQLWRAAERAFFDRVHVFADIQSSGNPLTRDEVEQLVQRDPSRWGFFRGLGV